MVFYNILKILLPNKILANWLFKIKRLEEKTLKARLFWLL